MRRHLDSRHRGTSISVMTRVASGCGGDWREVVGIKLRNPKLALQLVKSG